MKREILFRGYSESLSKWVEGDLVRSPSGQCRIYLPAFEGSSFNTWFQVHPDSVGQFTGEIDIHTNNIFEEMSVRLIDDTGRARNEYIVKFESGSFCLFHLPDYLGGQRWGLLSRVSELGWQLQITGNTFKPNNP
jgi:hypothetical protein